ncbi:hypothetical protein GCM10023155_34410 [Bremerella cremea]
MSHANRSEARIIVQRVGERDMGLLLGWKGADKVLSNACQLVGSVGKGVLISEFYDNGFPRTLARE